MSEAAATPTPQTEPVSAPLTPAREVWLHFRQNKGAMIGMYFIIALVIVAILADLLAPHSPIVQYREALLVPPVFQDGGSWRFILGTDDIGRDILSRLIHGARLSIIIGFIVVFLSLGFGVVLGLSAAFARGTVEILIMRLMDIMLALPSLLLAIVIVAILGPGLFNAMIAVSIVSLPHFTRLARASAMSELTREYVSSARIAGAGTLRLMFRTVLPNCMAPLIVQ
ncbi:MAG: ABC transporter permease subunit, partial [Ferrovibrionaceae bacterium]